MVLVGDYKENTFWESPQKRHLFGLFSQGTLPPKDECVFFAVLLGSVDLSGPQKERATRIFACQRLGRAGCVSRKRTRDARKERKAWLEPNGPMAAPLGPPTPPLRSVLAGALFQAVLAPRRVGGWAKSSFSRTRPRGASRWAKPVLAMCGSFFRQLEAMVWGSFHGEFRGFGLASFRPDHQAEICFGCLVLYGWALGPILVARACWGVLCPCTALSPALNGLVVQWGQLCPPNQDLQRSFFPGKEKQPFPALLSHFCFLGPVPGFAAEMRNMRIGVLLFFLVEFG